MQIGFIKVDGSTNQLEVHAFCREGLTDLVPVASINIHLRPAHEDHPAITRDMHEALHIIHGRMVHDEILQTMEIYSDGFNVWLYNMKDDETSVGVFRYRRNPIKEPLKSILDLKGRD